MAIEQELWFDVETELANSEREISPASDALGAVVSEEERSRLLWKMAGEMRGERFQPWAVPIHR